MAITNIPGWGDNISDNVSKTALQAYSRVALMYKCANLVANSASTAPFYLMYEDNEMDWVFGGEVKTLIRRVVKDLQLYGASYILKVGVRGGNVKRLRRLNANGMRVELLSVNDDGQPVYRFEHNLSNSKRTRIIHYTHEEIIYIKMDSEWNDIEPDVYPASVAFGSAKVLDYLQVFGEVYFDAGAMPTTLLSVTDGYSQDEIGRLEQWVKRRISGIKKAFGVFALSANVSVHHMNPPAKDLAIPELDELNRKRVMEAFGVPEGMVDKSANYASAETHQRQFWDMTVKPIVELVLTALNTQLFGNSGYELIASFEELSVYQVDEARRSAAFSNLVNSGLSLEAAWWTLGYQDLPEDIAMVGRLPADTQQEPFVTDDAMIEGETGEDEAEDGIIKGVATVPSLFTHLDAWKNKAINRIRQGKSLDFYFESDLIPNSMKSAIEGALIEADADYDAVRSIFDNVVDMHHSHSYKAY